MEVIMAKKAHAGVVNKSAEIRSLLRANPKITANEVIGILGHRRIKVGASLFYFTKGKMKGRKGRRRQIRQKVESVIGAGGTAPAASSGGVVATIKKVKGLAAEVGGLRKLLALVEALSE
jgi:hypothetical protein